MAALGGGHGLASTLSALRFITDDITAIVTVADNGGSSGRLRSEFGVYGTDTGRICVAALNSKNIDYVCQAIAKVI